VSAATTGTGLADWLNWIPDDIGKLATAVGILLSLVLVGTTLFRARMDYQKHRAELKKLEADE